MFVLIRAITWSTLFVGALLVFLPARILSAAGVAAPAAIGPAQAAGMAFVAVGAAIMLWCIMAFVFIGKGTAAPFDPPKALVVRGPYRYLRNPMYVGAGLALAGVSLFYGSAILLLYVLLLAFVVQTLVIFYEEPILSRKFGPDYDAYRKQVNRWLPRV